MVIVDAGPLVALIHVDDNNHTACKSTLRGLTQSMATVWPAFTEAMYLLGFSWKAQDSLWEMLHRRVLTLLPLDDADAPRIRELMHKYRDLPDGPSKRCDRARRRKGAAPHRLYARQKGLQCLSASAGKVHDPTVTKNARPGTWLQPGLHVVRLAVRPGDGLVPHLDTTKLHD